MPPDSRLRDGRDREAILCSLAILDALVSLANRGVNVLLLGRIDVIGGTGVSVRDAIDTVVGDSGSRLRTDRGAPCPTGVFTKRLSATADVGRSSKDSNSVPSP